jgi:hypothetical protein
LSDAAVAAFALPDLREEIWRFPSHWVAENVCLMMNSFTMHRTLAGISASG